MIPRTVYQLNLQNQFGGGEVYTNFFSKTLLDLGYRVVLFVSQEAEFWEALLPDDVEIVRVRSQGEIQSLLPNEKSLLVTQTVLDSTNASELASRHRLCGIVHMPLYERSPPGLVHYDVLIPVSRHVMDSMQGRTNVYSEPLYAVSDVIRGTSRGPILAASEYEWDRRKMRDRLMGLTEPVWRMVRPKKRFEKLPGLTIGIVSRITPIKQFPLMFGILAPVMARWEQVHLEIFGSGGYASVRDLRNSLAPMYRQVRFWGHQKNVAAIYPEIDYVLSGLPEKEALGLNMIEAQQCGTPAIAVRSPPFTETVLDGQTGFLFSDPREDDGASFAQLLQQLLCGMVRPDPRLATEHMARFSYTTFKERVARLLLSLTPTSNVSIQ